MAINLNKGMNLNKAKEAYERLQNERRNLSREIANIIKENGICPGTDGSMRIVFPEEFVRVCSIAPPMMIKTYDNGVVYEIQKDCDDEEEIYPEYAMDLLEEYVAYLKRKEFLRGWSKNVDSNLAAYYKAEQSLWESLYEYIDIFGREPEDGQVNMSKIVEFECPVGKTGRIRTYEGWIDMSGIGEDELGNIYVMDGFDRWIKLGLCKDIGDVFRVLAKYMSIIQGMQQATTEQPADVTKEGSPDLCGSMPGDKKNV